MGAQQTTQTTRAGHSPADIRAALDEFIEWPAEDRSTVSTTSAVLFAREMMRRATADPQGDRAFWDAAMIAVASGLAAHDSYNGHFPTGIVIDAGIVADALLEERRARWGATEAGGAR